jgi:hypothetical protein
MTEAYTEALWRDDGGGRRPELSPEAAAAILATPPSSYTLELLRDWFAAKGTGGGPRFDARSAMVIPKAFRPAQKDPFPDGGWPARAAPGWEDVTETTPGRYAANNLIFSRTGKLRAAFPYFNVPWESGVVNEIQTMMCDALLDERIDAEDAAWVVDRMQWLGYAPTSFLAPSMTIDTLRLPPVTRRLKAEILAGPRGDAARGGDTKEIAAIEQELLASARTNNRGDPGMEIYASGSRGSFG